MFPVTNILNKVLVARFYERNLGFFFFLFYAMFGIVESSQIVNYHLSLIYGMIDSLLFELVVFTAWLFYMAKCLQFIFSQLDSPENAFLIHLSLLDKRVLFRFVFTTLLLVYAPVLIYTVVILGVAIKSGHYLFVAGIVLYHLLLLTAATFTVMRKISTSHKSSFSINIPLPKWKGPKPYVVFYLQHLTSQLPTVFFFSKLFSVLVLYGFLQIPLDHYDVRVALLGLLLGLAGHAAMVLEFRKFEDRYLEFTRTLPISISSRFIKLLQVYAILLLPEIILMAIHGIHSIELLPILSFGCGFLLFFHCSLYRELNMEKLQLRMLAVFLISFLLVLCKVYLVVLVLFLGYAFYRFYRDYNQYEGAKGETVL